MVSKKSAIDYAENVKNCKYTWGVLNVEKFVKKLNDDGMKDIKVEQGPRGSIIHLVSVVFKFFIQS